MLIHVRSLKRSRTSGSLWSMPGLLALSLALASGCVTTLDKRRRNLSSSGTTSISIGMFEGNWQSLDVTLTRQDSKGEIKRSYPRSMFGQDGVNDIKVEIVQGTYLIDLTYKNAANEVVFRSCPSELNKKHDIKVARYKAAIDICPSNSATPSGQVPVNSTADVTITPKPSFPGDQGGQGNQAPPGQPSGPTPSAPPSGSPFSADSRVWVDPYSQAANDANALTAAKDPRARAISYIAAQPAAIWYGAWSGDIGPAVAKHVSQAKAAKAYALMIFYNIPYRDCGQHSAGGLSATQYGKWIEDAAAAIGDGQAIVVLEPDAVTLTDCLSPELKEERNTLLKKALARLKAQPNTKVYIDAGHSAWHSVDEIVSRLQKVDIDKADGFALNVSNYQTTDSNVEYGKKIAGRVGGKHFVVDTSRNGNGPMGSVWCNPRGRALGKLPTFNTGITGVDGFLWLKRPGESDGSCENGNSSSSVPAAGAWWRDVAVEMARNAGIQ